MDAGRFTTRRLAPALALALCGALAGCNGEKPEVHPVWPPPPAQARVVHLRNIRGGDDMGRGDFFRSLGRMITGDKGLDLLRPHDIAVQEDRRLYVTDQERQALVILEMGRGRARLLDRVDQTLLVSPVGVELCGQALAMSDSALRAVFVLDLEGKFVRRIEKPGGFARPTGLAYDAGRNRLYVADTLAHEVCVFDFAKGELLQRIGKWGSAPGEFNFPTHISVDAGGALYVTDSMNFRIQTFDPQGRLAFHLGKQGDATGHLAVPKSVATDSAGHLYVVDSYFGRISIFDRKGQFLLAVGEIGSESGMFQVPAGLAVDSQNRIYVCDSYNRRIQVLQYTGGGDDGQPQDKP